MNRVLIFILACFLFACGPAGSSANLSDIQIHKGRCDQIADNKVANGTVENVGKTTFKFVQLKVTIYRDDVTKPLNTKISYIDSEELAPGASSTYKIYIPDPGDDAYNCKVEVASAK